jgi:hypothetical protein
MICGVEGVAMKPDPLVLVPKSVVDSSNRMNMYVSALTSSVGAKVTDRSHVAPGCSVAPHVIAESVNWVPEPKEEVDG